ncbi:MAG: Maf family protein [Candidatus Sungiibacteriota bacterium]
MVYKNIMPRIILASASPQRKNLFAALNLPFEIIPADIDEAAIRDPDPKKQALLIARAKCDAVARREQGIIIAADTFCVYAGKILEKPRDQEEAAAMLHALSGNTAIAYTGLCYLDAEHGIHESAITQTEFTFRELSTDEIARYVEILPVTTWSAAFSPAYPYGMTLVSRINGSFTGFTHGLPMELLIPLLRRSGIAVQP